MDAQTVKQVISRIQNVLDWWEYDGSINSAKKLMEELAHSLPDLRHELQHLPKYDSAECIPHDQIIRNKQLKKLHEDSCAREKSYD